MFTGIVESVGSIVRVDRSDAGMELSLVLGSVEPASLKLGDSVSISGVCLTVTGIEEQTVDVQASNETIARTNFGQYSVGTQVNIERPLTLNSPLGGHLVSGHIDGTAKCVRITPDGDSRRIEFEVSGEALGKFMVQKGSVTIDGVSMTVNSVVDRESLTQFDVNVIPHTLSVTTLGSLKVSDSVHIEIDNVARYVNRLMEYYGLQRVLCDKEEQ